MTQKVNVPNRLTIARFVLSLVILFLMVFPYAACGWTPNEVGSSGFSVIDLVCCVLFIIGSITDTLDGNIARSQGLISDFGKFMDPLADKALVDTALIVLSVTKPTLLPVFITVLFVIRDLAVDGLRFLAASEGEVIAANKWGKTKTVAQMIAIPFIFLNGFPLNYLLKENTFYFTIVLISIALILSLISGGIYIYDGRRLIQNMAGVSKKPADDNDVKGGDDDD
jgi:CDP-diacylglycerol--glycerol-3-phosphate 3-phosphatidyltransferase